jgi:uncharacterized RDD family membrane protein YckC
MGEYKLVISDKEIELSPGITRIGRASDSDIVLEDKRVSSAHAQIELVENKLLLKDLNSQNGTYVNGSRICDIVELSDGNIIQIINHKFKVKMPKPTVEHGGTVLDLSRPCPNCAERVFGSYKFCPYCGSSLELLAEDANAAIEPESGDARNESFAYTKKTVRAPRAEPAIKSAISATAATIRKGNIPQPQIKKVSDYKPVAKRITEEVEREAFIAKKPVGFWLRLVAYFLDAIFVNLISLPLIVLQSWVILYFMGENISSLMQGITQGSIAVVTNLPMLCGLAALLYTLISILYFLSGWARKGGTWGKRILGIKIYTEQGETPIGWGRAIIRLIGYFVSSLIFCVGFLMIGITNRKRGLHDMIAGTYVVHER